jgi:hypothetical protein
MEFWLMPVDYQLDQIVEEPQVWAGVTFDAPIAVSSVWRGRLEEAGFRFDEDEDGEPLDIGIQAPLGKLLAGNKRASEQAETIASWIDLQLNRLEKIGPRT